jgi:intein-encoded DNA endonuclease-like protein
MKKREELRNNLREDFVKHFDLLTPYLPEEDELVIDWATDLIMSKQQELERVSFTADELELITLSMSMCAGDFDGMSGMKYEREQKAYNAVFEKIDKIKAQEG